MTRYCPHCEEKMTYDLNTRTYMCIECEYVIVVNSPLTKGRRNATVRSARREYSRSPAYQGNG